MAVSNRDSAWAAKRQKRLVYPLFSEEAPGTTVQIKVEPKPEATPASKRDPQPWLAHLYVFCKGGDHKVGSRSFSLRTTVNQWGEIKMKTRASAA